MGGYAAIVAVLLSTLLRCGNTVPVSGDSHNVANASKPIISSASVNTPAGGMVFNHVYNINVPPVLCAGAGGQVTETSGTVEVGEGGEGAPFLANTFVPGGGGGGCCNNNGGSGSSGDLLNGETGSLVTALQESTEDLKKQLAELLKEFEQFKQSCGCVGAQGQPGVCDPACKYGKCENGRCVCDEGFTGDDCSERACPDNCKDRGDCVNGVCVCKPGFTGADCSQRACVPDCGDRGRCVNGVCQCEPGFEGPTCTSRSCPSNCMGRGVCVDGVCQCEPGFTGPDCSSTSCPNDCFGRGVCVDGVCQCEPGFVGEDCSAEISVPAPISGVFTRDITINSVFIGWVEEDYVDKYHLEYRRTNELNGWNEIEVFEPGYTVTGLASATEYQFRVSGANVKGRGEPSDVVEVSTKEDLGSIAPKGAPGAASAVTRDASSLLVEWEAPTLPEGSPDLLGYRLFWRKVGEGEYQTVEVGPGELSYVLMDLNTFTEYEMYVIAFNANGDGPNSDTFTAMTAEGVPGAPVGLMGEAVDSQSITVRWNAPEMTMGVITGYKITYQPEGGNPAEALVPGSDLSHLLTGLTPYTVYTIYVVGLTSQGEGDRSDSVSVRTFEGAPARPVGVMANALDARSIQVTWQEPEVNRGIITAYNVYYQPASTTANQEPSKQTVSPYELFSLLGGLQPATEYVISVAAITSAGEGERSDKVTAQTRAGVPGPPTDLSAVERTSDSVKLSWQAPEGDIEGYRVFYSLAGSDTEETVDTRSPDASWSLSGLQSFGEYSISVLAYNSAGDGERSETITVQTEEGVPGAPREVQGLAIDSTTIELQWMPPSPDEQNGVIKGYKILYKKVGEEGENEEDAGLLDLMYTLSDLEKWTEYNIWVSAYTSAGDGLRSPVIVVRTGEDVPGPPIGIEARPGDDSASVLVQWQQPIVQNGVIVGYKILYQKSGEEDVEVTDIGSPQVAFTLSGLDWNDYNIWVVAYTGAGDGDRSDPVLVRPAEGVPGPPSAVFARPLDFDTMEVRWQPPLYIYGQLLGYKVLYRSVNEIENQVVVTPTTEPSFTLPGLDADTIYIISVVAYTMAGDGPRSNEFVVRTLEGVPGPAQSLSGLVWDSQSVQLRWQPPYNAHGQIRGYKVFYQRMGQITPSTEDTQSTGLVHKLSGLKKWTEYIISVAAYTSRGDGMKSNQIIIRTMQDVPGAPEDVQGIAQGSNALRVTWQPPTDRNGVIQGYKVYYARMGTEDYIEIDTQNTELSFELSELRPWTSYTFSVSAYTSVGEGPQSSKVTTRTEEGVPTVGPGGLNAEAVDAESIRVSWTRISDAEAGGALQGYQVFYQAITADGALEISDAQIYKVEGADTLEATLTGLEAGTRYAITVSGYTSSGTGIRADLVEATTQTGIPYPNPSDCGQVVANGESESGPFTVYPTDGSEPIEVWCDMETDGGGWIVFQRRQDGSVDFWRRWREYRAGFGENTGEFWLGNDNIHRLSNQGEYQLRIDLGDGADAVYGEWDNFKLGSESDLYKLIIGEYSGTSGDSLTYHNNRPFSTRDKDNDVALSHCAFAYHGAWWYKNCHRSNLNGQYGDNTHSQGVNWYHWKGHEKSVPFVEMKMRSMDFKTKYARAE